MLNRRSALPLQADAASRFLPWIVALMVFLAGLALAGALTVDDAIDRWRSSQTGALTIQIAPDENGESDARVAAVLEVLSDTPGIAAATALARDELVSLLEPWLGKGNVTDGLPLPQLIDATLTPGVAVDLGALAARLEAAAPGARIDDPALWLDRLADAARALQAVAVAVVLAIGAAAVGTVVFTTRTSLAVHRESIEVLHLIGAQDGFVAHAFAWQSLWLGLRGGLVGLAFVALTIFVVRHFGAGLDAPLLPRLELTPAIIGSLAALPVASALVAMLTARVTVLRTLARMP